ncbi:MAG: PIN domain-containing protein [Burkholderiaceae bacterium]
MPLLLVLDTNVVLDWLYFRDPRCDALARTIRTGRACWLASGAMHDELAHVLGRGVRTIGERAGDAAAVLAGWRRWATPLERDGRAVPPGLRCSDADDQKFIDLAWQVGASALLSRDRAVLKLARRAALHGLRICDVDRWPGAADAGSTQVR